MNARWIGVAATAIAVGAGPGWAASNASRSPSSRGQSSETQSAEAQRAAVLLASAWAALGKGDAAKAVHDAEAGTMLLPNDAGMRALLGRAYLAAGRFRSADGAFADALTLDPTLSRALVSRMLAQIALGDADGARALLAKAEGVVPDADIGLAQALLGDTEGARKRLNDAARAVGADARTRQNLGLVYALDGRWVDAVAIAEQDVPADQMPQRLRRWAMIAQMKADPAMQVGAILGVLPAADAGQPGALALAAPVAVPGPAALAVAAPSPSPSPSPSPIPASVPAEQIALAEAAPAPAPAAMVAPIVRVEASSVVTEIHPVVPSLEALVTRPVTMAAIALPDVAPALPDPVLIAEHSAPQPEPVVAVAAPVAPIPPVAAAPARVKLAVFTGQPGMRGATTTRVAPIPPTPSAKPATEISPVAATTVAKNPILLASQVSFKPAAAKALGNWAVQLGAFSSLGHREVAWRELNARAAFLSAYTPTGAGLRYGKATLYRLSVSGLPTRKDAVTLCVRIRAAGGACFVRNMSGDQPMRWALRKSDEPVKLASAERI